MKKWDHQQLCDKAVAWLKRPRSSGGPGCHMAVSEIASGYNGEVPDAIGFRATGGHRMPCNGSVLVEAKISRSDFLADKKKPHRTNPHKGIGNWRYYLCPEGVISPEELPEKWGLIYITKRGAIKPVVGPATERRYGKCHDDALAEYKFDVDSQREQYILVRLFQRVGNEEELNKKLKESYREQARLANLVNDKTSALREMETRVRQMNRQMRAMKRQADTHSGMKPDIVK